MSDRDSTPTAATAGPPAWRVSADDEFFKSDISPPHTSDEYSNEYEK
jgi:hypothetical protein